MRRLWPGTTVYLEGDASPYIVVDQISEGPQSNDSLFSVRELLNPESDCVMHPRFALFLTCQPRKWMRSVTWLAAGVGVLVTWFFLEKL